jgi:hypothetical protein
MHMKVRSPSLRAIVGVIGCTAMTVASACHREAVEQRLEAHPPIGSASLIVRASPGPHVLILKGASAVSLQALVDVTPFAGFTPGMDVSEASIRFGPAASIRNGDGFDWYRWEMPRASVEIGCEPPSDSVGRDAPCSLHLRGWVTRERPLDLVHPEVRRLVGVAASIVRGERLDVQVEGSGGPARDYWMISLDGGSGESGALIAWERWELPVER